MINKYSRSFSNKIDLDEHCLTVGSHRCTITSRGSNLIKKREKKEIFRKINWQDGSTMT